MLVHFENSMATCTVQSKMMKTILQKSQFSSMHTKQLCHYLVACLVEARKWNYDPHSLVDGHKHLWKVPGRLYVLSNIQENRRVTATNSEQRFWLRIEKWRIELVKALSPKAQHRLLSCMSHYVGKSTCISLKCVHTLNGIDAVIIVEFTLKRTWCVDLVTPLSF